MSYSHFVFGIKTLMMLLPWNLEFRSWHQRCRLLATVHNSQHQTAKEDFILHVLGFANCENSVHIREFCSFMLDQLSKNLD